MPDADPFPDDMPPHSTTNVGTGGRFGNNIIRSSALSFLAEKYNLFATYIESDKLNRLGLRFFCGDYIYPHTIKIHENEYLSYLLGDRPIRANVDLTSNVYYFQKRWNILLLYNYLHEEHIRREIVAANPYKDRYNNNNDCYIHVRLGDVVDLNPRIRYYELALARVPARDKIYISSDTIDHEICQTLISKYGAVVFEGDEVETMQFASTCKYMILSNGTFSSVMGYLNYTEGAQIYYPEEREHWHGDLFCIEGWNKILVRDFWVEP